MSSDSRSEGRRLSAAVSSAGSFRPASSRSRLGGIVIFAWITHSPQTASSELRSTAKFSSSGGVVSSAGVWGHFSRIRRLVGSVISTPPPRFPSQSPQPEESFAQAGDRRSWSYRRRVALVVNRRRSLIQGHALGRGLRWNRLNRRLFRIRIKHQKLTTEIRIASATPTADNPARKKRPAHITA